MEGFDDSQSFQIAEISCGSCETNWGTMIHHSCLHDPSQSVLARDGRTRGNLGRYTGIRLDGTVTNWLRLGVWQSHSLVAGRFRRDAVCCLPRVVEIRDRSEWKR